MQRMGILSLEKHSPSLQLREDKIIPINQGCEKLRGKEMGKQWKQCQTLFWGAPKSLQIVIAAMKLKDTYSLGEKV